MTDSVSIDERAHDIKTAARTKQIEALQDEEYREIMRNITFEEIIEAMAETPDEGLIKRFEASVSKSDYAAIGARVCAMVGFWASLKAVKKVDSMIDKGDV